MRRQSPLRALGVRLVEAVLLGLLWITPAEPGAASERLYRVTGHWTAADGLPQNSIKTLAQTSDGSLWVGTLSGLARFDGIRFKVFDHRNTPEMTHDSVNDLAIDRKDGGLWISTGNGLLYYQDHRFEVYGPKKGIVGPAGVLWPAAEGGAWCSPQPGEVARVRDGKVRVWHFGLGLHSNMVHQICETGHSATQLLVVLGDGPTLYKLDLASNSLQRLDVPWKEEPCFSLCPDTNEHVWFGCCGYGIWRGKETNWTQLAMVALTSRQLPKRVCRTSEGQIWVTVLEDGQARLHRLVDGELRPFVPEGFLPGTSIDTLLPGREGEVWVGTEAGLYRLAPEPEAFRTFSSRDGLRSDNTLTVAAGTDDTVWVGTALGIQGIQDGRIRNVEPPPRLGWVKTSVILVDKHNAVWLGWPNPESLWTLSGERWENQIHGPMEVQSIWEAKALYEDHQGRVWMATGQAVLCKNGEPWQTFASNSLSCPDVRVIYQDRRGDLWFGTFGGGLNRLRNGTFTAYKTERGDHNNRCWWIYEDADGVFWIGSEDGLNRFVPPDDAEEQGNHNPKAQPPATGRNRFFTFTKEQGLPDNVINNIQEDDFGCLWLSGLRGIYRVSREQLNAVAAGRLSTVTCTIFGETDGMLSSECNGGDNQPAGCKDRLGRIWFPTVQGVVMIDPKLARSAGDPPPVLVEQVKANGQVVFGDDLESSAPQRSKLPRSDFAPYRLPPGTARAIEIFYTANTFADPGRIRFKYRLEGYDRDWLWDEQNRRTVSYANLKPGRYTFRVTACDSHGCWNEQGAQFAFYIEPFFWQTWPFYIAIAALALATAMGLHHQRVARVRRVERLEQERSLADERARIARDLHDDLGASLSALSLFEKRGRP